MSSSVTVAVVVNVVDDVECDVVSDDGSVAFTDAVEVFSTSKRICSVRNRTHLKVK